jgi:hypothetical protein
MAETPAPQTNEEIAAKLYLAAIELEKDDAIGVIAVGLDRAEARGAAGLWRPMETAPRDGTHCVSDGGVGEHVDMLTGEVSTREKQVWLPKSQCEWNQDDKVMTMPEWLAMDKELI